MSIYTFTFLGIIIMIISILVGVILFNTSDIRNKTVYFLFIVFSCLPLLTVLIVNIGFERGSVVTNERECKLAVNNINKGTIYVIKDDSSIKEYKVGNINLNVSTKGYSYAVLTDYSWGFFHSKDEVTKVYIAVKD